MNKDTDIFPGAARFVILDSKSVVCMSKNGKDIKHTRHIDRIVHFVINVNSYKMHNIEWCEGGLQLADIEN